MDVKWGKTGLTSSDRDKHNTLNMFRSPNYYFLNYISQFDSKSIYNLKKKKESDPQSKNWTDGGFEFDSWHFSKRPTTSVSFLDARPI